MLSVRKTRLCFYNYDVARTHARGFVVRGSINLKSSEHSHFSLPFHPIFSERDEL